MAITIVAADKLSRETPFSLQGRSDETGKAYIFYLSETQVNELQEAMLTLDGLESRVVITNGKETMLLKLSAEVL